MLCVSVKVLKFVFFTVSDEKALRCGSPYRFAAAIFVTC